MWLAPAQLLKRKSRQHLTYASGYLRRRQSQVLEAKSNILLDILADDLVLGILKEHPDITAHVTPA